jgi:HAD superfamily hydrolase (TIGR01509 family)
VTSEMVQNQKPAPDIFLEAARRIGVDPKCCRGYEDTDLGMQAIRSAGMEAVDVRELIGVKG